MNLQLFQILNNLAGKNVWFDRLTVFFAVYSGYILVLALMYIFFFSKRARARFMSVTAIIAAVISRFIFALLFKMLYHHPRPFDILNVHQLIPENGNSFPSGHASFFFTVSTIVFGYNKKWGIAFYAISILMGLARVAAGVHWPVDVLAGTVLGIAVGWMSLLIIRKTKPLS